MQTGCGDVCCVESFVRMLMMYYFQGQFSKDFFVFIINRQSFVGLSSRVNILSMYSCVFFVFVTLQKKADLSFWMLIHCIIQVWVLHMDHIANITETYRSLILGLTLGYWSSYSRSVKPKYQSLSSLYNYLNWVIHGLLRNTNMHSSKCFHPMNKHLFSFQLCNYSPIYTRNNQSYPSTQ